jgi:hypothetical protein
MSKNRGKSKLSENVLFNANKHGFHCEKSLGTLLYGQLSYLPGTIFREVLQIVASWKRHPVLNEMHIVSLFYR